MSQEETKCKMASFGMKVKVIKLLALVSLDKVLYVHACQIKSLYLLWLKSCHQGYSFPQTGQKPDAYK